MRRALAALLCACAAAAAGACGGSSGDEASEPATTATAPAPAPTAPGDDLAALLPPEDAVDGLRPGVARRLPTPQAFVAAFYLAGDPGRGAAARRRLAAGGYAAGLVRDQAGEDPEGGVALVRSYVVEMRDEEAARQEVADATEDVLDSPQGTASEIELAGIEGGRALRVELAQDEASGSAAFVTFPAGPRVYGIQAASREGADLPEDEVVAAAQDLAARVGAAP